MPGLPVGTCSIGCHRLTVPSLKPLPISLIGESFQAQSTVYKDDISSYQESKMSGSYETRRLALDEALSAQGLVGRPDSQLYARYCHGRDTGGVKTLPDVVKRLLHFHLVNEHTDRSVGDGFGHRARKDRDNASIRILNRVEDGGPYPHVRYCKCGHQEYHQEIWFEQRIKELQEKYIIGDVDYRPFADASHLESLWRGRGIEKNLSDTELQMTISRIWQVDAALKNLSLEYDDEICAKYILGKSKETFVDIMMNCYNRHILRKHTDLGEDIYDTDRNESAIDIFRHVESNGPYPNVAGCKCGLQLFQSGIWGKYREDRRLEHDATTRQVVEKLMATTNRGKRRGGDLQRRMGAKRRF